MNLLDRAVTQSITQQLLQPDRLREELAGIIEWCRGAKGRHRHQIDRLQEQKRDAAERLNRLPASVRVMPLAVFAVGWSERRSRMADIICNSADAMAPDEVVDAHAFGQKIATSYLESREAQCMADAPLELADLPRLHRLAATVATRQSRAGQLGIAVGGRLQTVHADRTGARIVAEVDLDELAAA